MSNHIGIVAGEASGDILGAGLIKALKVHYPDLRITGIGGPKMIEAGCESLFDQEELAVMGIVEPLKRLPRLLHIRRQLYQHFSKTKPQIVIGIDSPDFNLDLELKLKKEGLRTAHYVSPSVWAWRQYRIHKIARAVDLMLTLLPFEAAFYQKHKVPVQFVGHPLAERVPLIPDKKAARLALGLDPDAKFIALLPGSRAQELKYLGQPFLEAALMAYQRNPSLAFISSAVNAEREAQWRQLHQKFAKDLPLHIFRSRSPEVMAAADAVLVTSGTATLETMLYKRPMVIAYRTSAFNFMIGKWLIKTPFIGLPNLLAGEALVPELIQEAVEPKRMAELLLEYLDQPEKTAALEARFTALHEQLLQGADQKAAKAIMAIMTK